jgi:signal transduction histidine kinase
MKRTTLKLITVLFLTLLLSFTALLLVFRHVMSNHIETNASQAIEYVKEELSDPELYYDDDALFEWEQTHEMPSTVASCLLVGKTYKTQSYELARRRELAKWCSRHGAPDGTTQSVSLGGRAYFVSQIPNTTEEGNGEGIWIIYVDVTGENALIRRMDLDMILVMVLCAALACVCGIRIGVSIERGQERQKKFFENASHELKTPLMSIQGYAEGICSGVIQDEKHAAAVIMSESDKMTALVEEILCLSRFESGETRLHRESVSVPGLVNNCLVSLESVIVKKGLSVETHLEEAEVQADVGNLETAFTNLLSNAVKYGRSRIVIACDSRSLSVWNDGEKLSKEDAAHIFERFYIGKNGSTGIGLALTKEIIERHGWQLQLRNREDGPEFVIKFT